MTQDRLPLTSQYSVVTFSKPVIWPTGNEYWLLNPMRRHVMNAATVTALSQFVASLSDLAGSSYYTPLTSGKSLASAKILVERNRDRGIGDLLFLTGPLSFFQHVSGGNVNIDVYSQADRGAVLTNHPALAFGCTLAGPLLYDDMGLYNYHWMIPTATECNEEPDQLNVYDALYQQLGFDSKVIPAKFKRPSARLVNEDFVHLDQFFLRIWELRKIDLRRLGFYVVAPFSAATLRSMNYSTWLEIIRELSKRRPVVVVGQAVNRIPDMDMSSGEFQQKLSDSSVGNVVNAIGATPSVRLLMALVSKAVACVTLDSGTLYVAQALNTPAISIWGSHDPGVRIGYDKDYMELAVWNQPSCRMSPCFAYANFPAAKCSMGAAQTCCDVLSTVTADQVIEKMDMVESRNIPIGKFEAVK